MFRTLISTILAGMIFITAGFAQAGPGTKFDWTVSPKDLAEVNARILDWQAEYLALTAGKKVDANLIEAVLRLNLDRGLYIEKALIPYCDQMQNDISEEDWNSKYQAIAIIMSASKSSMSGYPLYSYTYDKKSMRWNWTCSLESPLGTDAPNPLSRRLHIPATDPVGTLGMDYFSNKLSRNEQNALNAKLAEPVFTMLQSLFPSFPKADPPSRDGRPLDIQFFQLGSWGTLPIRYAGNYGLIDLSAPQPKDFVDDGK